jgi:hypothetical protein
LPRQFANVGAQTQFGIANPVDVIGTFIGGIQIGVAIGIARDGKFATQSEGAEVDELRANEDTRRCAELCAKVGDA